MMQGPVIYVFYRHLAQAYATHHSDMAKVDRNGCGIGGYNFGKQGGITNGAAWYSIEGGMYTEQVLILIY